MYKGTSLAELNIQSKEIESKAIGKKSLADAKSLLFNASKHLENVGNHEVNDVERMNQIKFNVLGSRTDHYDVSIDWDLLEPRTSQKWWRRFHFACKCPGFQKYGSSDKFCQHILFLLMLLFKTK